MRKSVLLGCLALIAEALVLAGPSQAGDPGKGAELFRRCAVCHAVEAGRHKVGPSLAGVVGRPVASADGYRYSQAMHAHGESGAVWTVDALDEYLASPRAVVRGTRMAFPGVKNADDRADVIEYLKTLSTTE